MFYQQDGVMAAIFTEKQQHQISSWNIRQAVMIGEVKGVPFSELSHYLFAVSVVSAVLQLTVVTNEHVLNCFIIDRLSWYLVVLQLALVILFRIPALIMAHVPALMPALHQLKIVESKVHRMLCKSKVKIRKVDKQPYIEDGWIRCGDPNCKLMHKKNA